MFQERKPCNYYYRNAVLVQGSEGNMTFLDLQICKVVINLKLP